jgi:predicted aldo/keto reductase-like oxidoreductase
MQRETAPGQLEKRSLGKTGEKLSILGLGGVVLDGVTAQQASGYVSEAIDYGVNYFDVAPTYGNAEDMMGPALKPYRKDVFLACKTQERKKEGALEELERSLKKLQTDHFDLYQLHAVTKPEDAQTILAPGGALEAFVKARQDGKIRFLGFSAHSVEAAMMLLDGYEFDTILFPFNFRTWHAGNFGPQVLQKAKDQGMGLLALKSMAKGPWPEGMERTHNKCWYQPLSEPTEAKKALRFTLSHPITAAIPPGNEGLFQMALKLAVGLKPLSNSEVEEVKREALDEGTPLFRYPSQRV